MYESDPICAHCGESFQPARADARYCSTACRVSAHRAASRENRHSDATLINEIIDAHGRATRLYASAKPTGHGLIHLVLTSTFSGAQKPDAHRVVWQTSLPGEAIESLREVLDGALRN